jgi:hypothetical protein
MRKSLLCIFALLCSLSIAKAQTTRYVNYAATGSNNGTSWTNAYTDLQTAITASSSGDQLWVAKGTYKPHASDASVSFNINGLTLIGGFAGGETMISERDVISNATILSGDLSSNDAGFVNSFENALHVVIVTSSGNATTIDGFTISGGHADG